MRRMKNVIILGAGGNIAKHVIDILVKKDDINLTLFLRDASRLRNKAVSRSHIVEGDVLNFNQLKEAIAGQDIVYANYRPVFAESLSWHFRSSKSDFAQRVTPAQKVRGLHKESFPQLG